MGRRRRVSGLRWFVRELGRRTRANIRRAGREWRSDLRRAKKSLVKSLLKSLGVKRSRRRRRRVKH